ncbi:MAG: class I SAM-dependent methyltransferase [Nanoarchaeota archaeon]
MKIECKVCNRKTLEEFINFGDMPAANAFLKNEDLDKSEYTYKMAVGFCHSCYMTQLINLVPYDKYIIPDETGKTNYAFFSSTSKFMEKHFAKFAEEVESRFLEGNKKVVEIGSNDGIMLKSFEDRKNVLGIEPSYNVAQIARKQSIETIADFFSQDLARKIAKEKKARAVISTNVFLNIIDIHDFVKGVQELLDEKGVFITEDPYLLDILEKNSYDQIYDEHIWYFSLSSLSKLFPIYDMEIFDAKKQEVHGGSMRVYIARKNNYEKSERLKNYLEKEKQKEINTIKPYLEFVKRIEANKEKFVSLIINFKKQGKKIVSYGAASKGTIVQNYCNLGPEIIDYVSDSTLYKQGLYTPGKHIPIVSPEVFHNDNADYAILFAWNHVEEIMEKEQEFLKRGGRFIVHLPEPRILEYSE